MSSNVLNESSGLSKWYNPPERKIPGTALAVTTITLAVFATLLASGVFGGGDIMGYAAIGLAVSAIPAASGAVFLLRPQKKPFETIGNQKNLIIDP